MLYLFLYVIFWTVAYIMVQTLLIVALPPVRRFVEKGYGLDLCVFSYLTFPAIYYTYYYGWAGLIAAIVGSVVALYVFCFIDPKVRPQGRNTINGLINSKVGTLNNHLALLGTAIAVPCFLHLRLAEIFIYPILTRLVRLPKYDQSEWVNVSRHKYDGLVGMDLIWCLYCDWMTGVYSMAGEMLRNVESFWCPVRFQNPSKCKKCVVEFPDIEEWAVPEEKSVDSVVDLMKEKYFNTKQKYHRWFGHADRKNDKEST